VTQTKNIATLPVRGFWKEKPGEIWEPALTHEEKCDHCKEWVTPVCCANEPSAVASLVEVCPKCRVIWGIR
jgi:hypothetical protein